MGFFISRQRDSKDNCLYLEISCGGPKKAGSDILPVRYEGEGKNLVDPRDAVDLAEKCIKQWDQDYWDETKKIRIAGDSQVFIFDYSPKGIAGMKKWADTTFALMSKCGACGKVMGSREVFESNDIVNLVFCSEVCFARKYRDMFGIEPGRLEGKKRKR